LNCPDNLPSGVKTGTAQLSWVSGS